MTDPHTVRRQAEQLSKSEQWQLVKHVLDVLEQSAKEDIPRPRRSLLGILADDAPAPSAEEIDDARREMWGNFPREDI
jgi:hypothetical protein